MCTTQDWMADWSIWSLQGAGFPLCTGFLKDLHCDKIIVPNHHYTKIGTLIRSDWIIILLWPPIANDQIYLATSWNRRMWQFSLFRYQNQSLYLWWFYAILFTDVETIRWFQFGMDGLFFGRLDYQDKDRRLKAKEMEMLWQGSANLGKIGIY